jgi:hypothetical protein
MKLGWKATLLVSTCLAAAPLAEANAIPLVEVEDSFGNTFGTATPVTQLSPDYIAGQLNGGDLDDYLKWSGLAPGTPYTFGFTNSGLVTPQVLDSADALLTGLSGNVPNDGILVFHGSVPAGSCCEGYRVELRAQLAKVPEPASIALFGVGVTAAYGLKRRRKAKKSQAAAS